MLNLPHCQNLYFAMPYFIFRNVRLYVLDFYAAVLELLKLEFLSEDEMEL